MGCCPVSTCRCGWTRVHGGRGSPWRRAGRDPHRPRLARGVRRRSVGRRRDGRHRPCRGDDHRRPRTGLPRPRSHGRAGPVSPAPHDRRRLQPADELLCRGRPRQLAHRRAARLRPSGGRADPGPAVAGCRPRRPARGSPAICGRIHATRIGLTPLDVAVLAGVTRAGLDTFAVVLAATVGLLLVVGCAAVALLLFVRIEARRTEFATRLALGGIGRAPGRRPGARSGDRRRRGRPRRTARRLVGAARRPRLRPAGRRGRVGARCRPRRAGRWPPRPPPAWARSRPSPAWPRCTPPCARRPPTCSRRRPPCGRGDGAGSATACSPPRWRWLSSS